MAESWQSKVFIITSSYIFRDTSSLFVYRDEENEEGRITREKRREGGEDENLKITAMLPRSVVIETELKPGATPNNPKLVTLRRV